MRRWWQGSEKASLVAFAFIGSSTVIATMGLVYERTQGTDFTKEFTQSANSFSLLKLDAPAVAEGEVTSRNGKMARSRPGPK